MISDDENDLAGALGDSETPQNSAPVEGGNKQNGAKETE